VRPPKGLSAAEAALWARLAATVKPLNPPRARLGEGNYPQGGGGGGGAAAAGAAAPLRHAPAARATSPSKLGEDRGKTPPLSSNRGLDSSWERKLARAAIAPDFTLDLHGHTLEQAHARLDAGLAQAKAMGARLVLLVTGKARPAPAADRGAQRGAIRAKVLDWLAAGPHASDIAAIRKAHRRHGGDGALYVVLRRGR
jgi:DNA-nicking Smr family endonuclease